MKKYVAKINGVSPLQQGRYHCTDKLEREQPDDYERRTWTNKAHADKEGEVFIPPMAFKNALIATARYLGKQIKGQGKKTYTAKFTSGVMISDPFYIGNNIDQAEGLWVFGSSTGDRGSTKGKRVQKCFPTFMTWGGELVIYVLDEIITKDVLKEHLDEAGKFVGVGVFRPECTGYYGRFEVESLKEV